MIVVAPLAHQPRRRPPASLVGRRPACGFTAVELMVTLAVLGILAAVTVPSAARVHGDAAARGGAQRLALVLRSAQAQACADGLPVEVRADADGSYEVVERTPAGALLLERGSAGARLTTNYPAGGVEFSPSGWPCSLVTHVPRAGSFILSGGVRSHTVTLQMGGRTRWQ
jgi:prepilin-type N-terminal cleavage/methylation domain-containing protein